MGMDHMAIKLPRMQIHFRGWLTGHRVPRQINEILLQAIHGVRKLNELGYIHRDLKPEYIMVTIEPLEVRIIDFNRISLISTDTEGNVRGTPGYFPERDNWKDGDVRWDIWAMGAIILEADMILDGYYHSKDELDSRLKATKHLKEPKTCKHINRIVRKTLMTMRGENIIGWDEMVRELKEA